MRELTCFPLPEGTYRRSSGYGLRRHPVTGAPGTFHKGVDYAAAHGTPLYAPFDGHVTTGNEPGGAGMWIWVDSGTDRFKSFHHSGYEVRSGPVRSGDVIAYIGTTGSSTGAHGHFELWEAGRNIDPTPFLDRAPIKGTVTAVAPATEEEEDVTVIAWDDQGAYACNGILRRPITPEQLEAYRFLGVKDLGKNDRFLSLFTIIPNDRMA